MTRHIAAAACIAIVGVASPAAAQPRAPGRVEFSFAVAWEGGTSLSAIAVNETQADGAARTVFNLAREQTSAAAIEGRVAVRAASRLDIEATGSYARPRLQLTASNDVEGAATATASEQLQEFGVGGGVLWYLRGRSSPSHFVPFLAGGVAYTRQLHETSTIVDTGSSVDMGGGIKRAYARRRGVLKAVGVRVDARARIRSSGLAVDGRTHVSPVWAAAVFFRF